MKPLAANTLLQNRYLIVHLIGKGGMGEVYLAVDQRLGSAVALKRTKFSDDETLGNAFEREAKTLARLRHPVLPRVSDHFIEQDNQFLIMEHISGDDLAKRLEINQKPFPLSWVLFWADQLLDALSYLHSHEPPIIHRDIKPQNLKLINDNNIILLDFGLSKNSVGVTAISQSGGSTGSVVGYTPHYAPMEQVRGTGTNPRSDIYSLSATLYQLLTNIVPPDALSRADALLSGTNDPLQPINEVNAEVAKTVSDVILKGMSVSQDQRFATAKEMQKALRDVYAQLQSAMAAQTVVFNAPQEVSESPHPQLRQKPEQAAAPPQFDTEPLLQSGIETQVIPSDFDSGASRQNKNAYNSQPQNQEPNFDATVSYDAEDIADILPKQSGIKTEVFAENDAWKAEPRREERFEKEEQFKAEENFSPEVSAPLISFDSRAGKNKSAKAETNYNSPAVRADEDIPPAAPFNQTENYRRDEIYEPAPPIEDYSQAEDYSRPAEQKYYSQPESPQPIQQQPTPVVVAPPAQKKSSGKILAIIGGIAALFILAVGAAGIIYLLKDSGKTGVTDTKTPTPATPSVTATPTPEEILVETNTDANTNSVSTGDLTNANANVEANNRQDVTKTDNPATDTTKPVQTQQQPTSTKPTKQTQVVTANKPVKTIPPKTPKPTPKKTDRTVILQ